jgi:hypothetical protein
MREGRTFLSCLVASLWSVGGVTVACGVGIGELLVDCPERGARQASHELIVARVVDGASVVDAIGARRIRRIACALRECLRRADSLFAKCIERERCEPPRSGA